MVLLGLIKFLQCLLLVLGIFHEKERIRQSQIGIVRELLHAIEKHLINNLIDDADFITFSLAFDGLTCGDEILSDTGVTTLFLLRSAVISLTGLSVYFEISIEKYRSCLRCLGPSDKLHQVLYLTYLENKKIRFK